MRKAKQVDIEPNLDLFTLVSRRIFQNPKLQDVRVDEFFQENQFAHFSALCQQRGVTFLSEIHTDLLQAYQSSNGVGPRRLELLHHKLLSVLMPEEPKPSGMENEIQQLFAAPELFFFRQYCKQRMVTQMKKITTRFLQRFAKEHPSFPHHAQIVEITQQYLPSTVRDTVFQCGDLYPYINKKSVMAIAEALHIPLQAPPELLMRHIEGKWIGDILNGHTYGEFLNLARALREIKDPRHVIPKLWKSLSKSEQRLFTQKYKEGLSDKAITALWRCDTKQIRVALMEIQQKLEKAAVNHRFYTAIALGHAPRPYISLQNIQEEFPQHAMLVTCLLTSLQSPFAYSTKLDLFFLEKRGATEELIRGIEDLPTICSEQDILRTLDRTLKEYLLSLAEIQPLLREAQYVAYGRIYAKQDKSMSSIVSYIVDSCLESDVEAADLPMHIRNAFGPSYDSSWLTSQHLAYAKSRLLTKTERLQNVKPVRKKVREVVGALLAELFEGMRQIRVKELYEVFEEELQKVKITNAAELCEVLLVLQATETPQQIQPTSIIRYRNQRIEVLQP